MKYIPATITNAERAVARKTILGGEKKLYVTQVQAERVGDVQLLADGSGTFTADPVTVLPAAGADLVVKVDGFLSSIDTDPVVLTLVGTADDDSLLSGTATFNPPGWVQVQSKHFGEGVSMDVTTNQVGRKWKTLTAVVPSANAKKGTRAKILRLPDTNDWQLIGKVESLTPNVGISPGISVPDGLIGTAEVLRGRSEESTFTVTTLNASSQDGLQRFAGNEMCLRLDIEKAGKLVTERHVLTNAIMRSNADFPDGNELSRQNAEGLMADACFFAAP